MSRLMYKAIKDENLDNMKQLKEEGCELTSFCFHIAAKKWQSK